jgi:anti-sigma factor RsiW
MNMNLEDCRRLMAGLADGELTPEERIAAAECLRRSAQCRTEYQQLLETSEKLELLSGREPDELVLEQLWRTPHHRLVWNAGLWLVLGSMATLLLYGLYELALALIHDSHEPLLPRIAVVALIAGGLLLFYSVLRERIHTYKVDRYKEIER